MYESKPKPWIDPVVDAPGMRPPRAAFVAVFLACGIAAGCALEPINGDTFSGSNVGRTISFEGYATAPGALMSVDVLDPPEQDPHDPSSTWRLLAQTFASTSAVYWTSPDPLYEWSANVTVVGGSGDAYLWPDGGVTRLRVAQNGEGAVTFDDADCIGRNLFEAVETMVLRCASHDSGILTLVDTDPVRDPDLDFLARKETAASEAAQYYRAVGAGPRDERRTLGGWLAANGFEASIWLHTGLVDRFQLDGAGSDPVPDLGGLDRSARSAPTGGTVSPLALRRDLVRTSSRTIERQRLSAPVLTDPERIALERVGIASVAEAEVAAASLEGSARDLVASFQATQAQQVLAHAQVSGVDAKASTQLIDRLQHVVATPLYDDVSAIYRNAADLGFGREMHCRQREDGGTACYVTNYGDPETPAEDSLADAIAHRNPFATVAMEYVPGASANQVRFYVYDGFGNLLEDAALDSQGAKAVPGVCLACHQGSYDSGANAVTGARFLPFDLDSFEYTREPGYTRADQEESFRKLNRIVLETNATAAMEDLIEGWYGATGVYASGTPFDGDHVPAGWSAQSTLYREVVKPYCRMCHVAKDSASGLDFLDFAGFEALASLIASRACGSDDVRSMPQAEVTYDAFWAGSARAHLVGALGLETSCVAD